MGEYVWDRKNEVWINPTGADAEPWELAYRLVDEAIRRESILGILASEETPGMKLLQIERVMGLEPHLRWRDE